MFGLQNLLKLAKLQKKNLPHCVQKEMQDKIGKRIKLGFLAKTFSVKAPQGLLD